MYPISEYGQVLFRLGWRQIMAKLWEIQNDDTGCKIYMDFRKNDKGDCYCNDNDGQPISTDVIEEWNEVAIFRKRQEEILKGVPLDKWELGR